jgi:hypothetical protein
VKWLAIVFLMGCATPCFEGFQLDLHATKGRYDGSDLAKALGGETDGFDSNYEALEFGGSLHFASARKCRAWGGEEAAE